MFSQQGKNSALYKKAYGFWIDQQKSAESGFRSG